MTEKNQSKEAKTGRLFLGIPLPADVRKELKMQSWPGISRYKNERLVPVYNWHFTLCFLGNIPCDQFPKLREMLNNKNFGSAFKMGIKNFGGFPNMEKARIIWAGTERGTDELNELAKVIRQNLDSIHIDYDQKPFVPHLTLCKLRFPKNITRLEEDSKMKRENIFNVDEIVLYESLNGSNQPYRPLMTIKLN